MHSHTLIKPNKFLPSNRYFNKCIYPKAMIRNKVVSNSIGLFRLFATSSRIYQISTTSLATSLFSDLFQTCNSCGIKLQTTDPNRPGYFIESKPKVKLIKREDEIFNKYLSNLSDGDKKLLINSANVKDSDISLLNQPKEIDKVETKPKNPECLRCRHVKFKSSYNLSEFPVISFDSIIANIPPNGNLVYIVNCQDFPFSIDPLIFKYRKPSEIKFIINKSDLLFKKLELSNNYGLKFFQDYLFRKFNVPPSNIMMTSGLIDWNINNILKFIDDYSYLIGNVNSGKSTIINSLIYYNEKKLKPNLLSSRDKIKLQKRQDKLINHSSPVSSVKLIKKEENKFKLLNGPGISFMPGFTRDHIKYDIDGKTIFDVPGFTNLSNHGIYELIDPKIMKQLNKGIKVFNKGMYNSRYDTIKGGQCLTVGGIFYLNIPSDSIFQIRSCINYSFKIFSSFEKSISVFNNIQDFDALKNVFITDKQSLNTLQRFVIPPFYGSIDLVFKNLGHLNLTPTGKRMNNDPLVIYLPKGVEAIIRQPITKYISKTLVGRDAKGNPLTKENWVSKSVTHLKRYSGSNPFYSRLIPANAPTTTDDDYCTISNYVSKVRGEPIKYTKDTVINEENRYDYWIEL